MAEIWSRNPYLGATLFLILLCGSCTSTRKAAYFDGLQDTEITIFDAPMEPIIRANDILSITVSSLNPDASEVFNKKSPTSSAYAANTTTTTQSDGYLVDLEGFIQFPILGNIRVAGMTKKEFKDQLTKTLLSRKLLVDPVVDVRYLNFRVSVMGEVAKPTVVTVPSEKISLLEAITLAGDLTITARRDNVMLIREETGKRIVRRIDLNSSTLFTSPYYYLKSNDVVYVEPNKARVASTQRITQWFPVIMSVMSFGIIVVYEVFR
jgi:polysaccharide export outer membrane protein